MSATTVPRRRTAAPAGRANPRHAGQRRGGAPLPRRFSGPVTGRVPAAPARHQGATVTARALALVRSLPEHSLLDRLVRGRAWIPVLGVLLAGIVAMQVEILKLGTTLGRSIARTATLQSKSESLQASIATLGDDQRIERLAVGMGMVTPSPGLLTFVGAHPQHQIARALANIHAPDPSGFAAQLAAQAATASLIAPSTSSSTSAGQPSGTQAAASTPGVPGSTASSQSPPAQTAQSAPPTTSAGQSTAAAAPTSANTSTVTPTPSVAASTGTGTVAPTGAAGLPASSTTGG